MHMSMPLILESSSYRAMYAFGNHFHVSNGEKHLTTSDSVMDTAITHHLHQHSLLHHCLCHCLHQHSLLHHRLHQHNHLYDCLYHH
jgi:hypothetical protein